MTFVSGWAGSKLQYPVLAEKAEFLVPFTGFNPEDLPRLAGRGGNVLIGWSTGAHMLLKDCLHLFSLYDNVVLIAPFISFTDSFPERLVKRMIAGMEQGPEDVVASFHANCGETLELPYDPRQRDALISGLEYLISSKIESVAQDAVPNLTLIRGSEDRIVRPKAFEPVRSFARPENIHTPECGHKVPEELLLEIIKGL